MHINSHFTPPVFGASSRPDHAANRRPSQQQQAEEAPNTAQDATATDTVTAVATAEKNRNSRAVSSPLGARISEYSARLRRPQSQLVGVTDRPSDSLTVSRQRQLQRSGGIHHLVPPT
jgi:hypothetical protein